MAPKNPIGRLADTAISTLKNPRETAGKVVEQAKGTAALGRMVAEQVGKATAHGAGAVVGAATGRKSAEVEEPAGDAGLRPVPDVNEPAGTTGVGVVEADSGSAMSLTLPKKGPGTRKAPGTKKPAAKAPGKKVAGRRSTAAEKAGSATPGDVALAAVETAGPSKRSAPGRRGPRKGTAKRTSATPADVAEVVEAAVAEDPTTTGATQAPTQGGQARKAAAKRTARKTPAKKAVAGARPPRKATGTGGDPLSAEQLQNLEGTDLMETPVGTPAAGGAQNPDTAEGDLNQPGTEGIVESSTVKAVASESEMLRKAAERNPE